MVASRKFTPGTMQDSRPDVQGQKNYKINYRKCCGSGFDRIRTILSISNFRSDLIIYADSNRRKNYLFVYIFVKISVKVRTPVSDSVVQLEANGSGKKMGYRIRNTDHCVGTCGPNEIIQLDFYHFLCRHDV